MSIINNKKSRLTANKIRGYSNAFINLKQCTEVKYKQVMCRRNLFAYELGLCFGEVKTMKPAIKLASYSSMWNIAISH
ncbi:MAG TPA: hypothetical protein DEO86_17340 [Colwellia sp.]|nr:hypothetical protein [Colwellia sp.]